MPSYDAPPDDGDYAPRHTYNFAPGSNGIVYRADVPDYGAGPHPDGSEPTKQADIQDHGSAAQEKETRYKLQSMRWGLIPFWTKRSPDYSSMLKTINCRDDSLAVSRGLWNSIKPRKRCIVICQGFYEWLKDPHNPKMKTPHYVKRADGQLMCMAGLWDCVKYENAEEKIYSYTVITTDSNKQLNFLHDRMPVILDNGSEEVRTWLDPGRYEWTKELHSLLKPYDGKLEVYPVSKEVGKVGNNSERFIIPVDSVENKANIANFFGNTKGAKTPEKKGTEAYKKHSTEEEIKHEAGEDRKTVDHDGTEDNAPLPVPASGIKREREEDIDDVPEGTPAAKVPKTENREKVNQENKSPSVKDEHEAKTNTSKSRRLRSATSNGTAAPSPAKANGEQKITSFFKK